jgi:glycosyltransferase involved in cell wall biosynthesis
MASLYRAREQLKIALVAPPWFPVPPDGYGGIEQVVGDLANGLSAKGHHVTLLATGDDRTDADFVATFDETPGSLGTPEAEWVEAVHAARACDALARLAPDVVHAHFSAKNLIARDRGAPTVLTVHGPIDDATAALYASVPNLALVAISDALRRTRPELNWVSTVHNGIDVQRHPFAKEKEDFYLFLGRISPDKGVDRAIRIARETGIPLVIAAKCSEPRERRYFVETIEPMLGGNIRYIGAAETAAKRQLLRSARALLFPIRWDEPFGLVMVEALACGTPVVATRRGSVPEIIVDGVTGFIADEAEDMIEAVRRIDDIDPNACRRDALERFDSSRMCDSYEDLYQRAAVTTPVASAQAK